MTAPNGNGWKTNLLTIAALLGLLGSGFMAGRAVTRVDNLEAKMTDELGRAQLVHDQMEARSQERLSAAMTLIQAQYVEMLRRMDRLERRTP